MRKILAALALFIFALTCHAQVTTDPTKTGIPNAQFLGSNTYTNITTNYPAASYTGYQARATDVGPAPGMLVRSNGVNWVPDGMQMFARAAVDVPLTGSTTETTVATAGTIPGGLLGVNGTVIVTNGWNYTSSANTKTLRVRLGGLSGTAIQTIVGTTAANEVLETRLRNRNSASTQYATTIGNNVSSLTVVLHSVNGTIAVATGSDQSLVITAQLQVGTETATLQDYEVWVLP
jgi:hypothetical protein